MSTGSCHLASSPQGFPPLPLPAGHFHPLCHLPPCFPARSRQHKLLRFISLGMRAGRVFGTTGVRFELSATGTQVLEPRLRHAPTLARLCECTRKQAQTPSTCTTPNTADFVSALSCAKAQWSFSFLDKCLVSKSDWTGGHDVHKGAKHVCAFLRCEC